MRITVLGGCGAWPGAGEACSGYLVELDAFRLLIDPGYATLPRLLGIVGAEEVDAVLISHGHADHTADLHPLLRARAFRDEPAPALPVFAPPGAVDPILALDRPGLLDDAYRRSEFAIGDSFDVGPFRVDTRLLPHSVRNAGLRLSAAGHVMAYTGDTGPSPDVIELARSAELFLAEASYPERVPADATAELSSALQAGEYAARAGVGRLVLTHLLPGTDPHLAVEMAARAYRDEPVVATGGLSIALD